MNFRFSPIVNELICGQNDTKERKLVESGFLVTVVERANQNNPVLITGSVLCGYHEYSVKIMLDVNRHLKSAICTCIPGISGKCEHVCAVVYCVNSPASKFYKDTYPDGELLIYEGGVSIASLFPSTKTFRNIGESEGYQTNYETIGRRFARFIG